MFRKNLFCCLLVSLLLVPALHSKERAATRPSSPGGPKQALVLGNSAYTHTSPLRNPVNDAKAIGSTLQQLGFEVTTLLDVNQRQMEQALRRFGSRLRDQNGVGLFYYAGHGMQVAGENYLLPVDINPSTETDVRYDAIPVGKLLGQMDAAGNGMNIVILDACRNNPFSRSFRSNSRGLAQVIAPTGSFISYATAPGNVAADGEGDNGLFTAKLLEHMRTPGLKLEEVFKRVRSDVQRESNDQQVPWDSSSVTGDFFFVPPNNSNVVSAPANNSQNSDKEDPAAQIWAIIENSENPTAFEEFLKEFPESSQARLAKFKLLSMGVTSTAPPLSPSETNLGVPLSSPESLSNQTTIQQTERYENAMIDLKAIRYELAFKAFQELAGEGHLESQHRLAMMHRFGLGTETDYKKAVEWLFKAANRGFLDSQYHLGIMYENGWGVTKNLEVANYWLEKAGQPTISLNSQSKSVVLNEDSEQIERYENAMIDLKAIRYKLAFRAFQKLAEEGHLESQHRLAMMHRFGLGTETDYKKAVEWLFKAANRGFLDSQYHLGIMYENGWGVTKNLEVANYWLKKAKETK